MPDKILRWLGGQQESFGADSAQGAMQAMKSGVQEAGSTLGRGLSGATDSAAAGFRREMGMYGKKPEDASGGGPSATETGPAPAAPATETRIEGEEE